MSTEPDRQPGLEVVISEDPRVVLYAEHLRDGRIALGTRRQSRDGDWQPGEMHVLDPGAYLDLASWLSPLVFSAWMDAVRERQSEPLRTARELYGEGAQGAARLAGEMVGEIPDELMARALVLLANSIGPQARNRLIQQLNRTTSVSEDAQLRRRAADESEAFAYAVAAAALFDALARGIAEEED